MLTFRLETSTLREVFLEVFFFTSGVGYVSSCFAISVVVTSEESKLKLIKY